MCEANPKLYASLSHWNVEILRDFAVGDIFSLSCHFPTRDRCWKWGEGTEGQFFILFYFFCFVLFFLFLFVKIKRLFWYLLFFPETVLGISLNSFIIGVDLVLRSTCLWERGWLVVWNDCLFGFFFLLLSLFFYFWVYFSFYGYLTLWSIFFFYWEKENFFLHFPHWILGER